jgi:general L-amino acid transport system permease protein
MAPVNPPVSPRPTESIPFWRDGRVLAVLAQIAFVILFLLAASWLTRNVLSNIDQLGPAQFRCREGGESFRCAFDFLSLEAQFDIAEKPIAYDPSNTYQRALLVGLLNTVKVAFFGIILATILGTVTGIARLSSNWLVSNVAKVYVDIWRNTPLLVQLFFLYFGVILLLPPIRSAIQPFGLPIYLSQRGIDMPWPVAMSSFNFWLVFLLLAFIPAIIVWLYLGRREKQLSRDLNRPLWALLAFLLIAAPGWLVAATAASQQAFLITADSGVAEFSDLETLVAGRLGAESLAEVDERVAAGMLSAEEVSEAALNLCVVRDTGSETNAVAEMELAGLPFQLNRAADLRQAVQRYRGNQCDLLVATESELTATRQNLDDEAGYSLVTVREMPVRLSIPRLQGLNFVGGVKLTPGFSAMLIGLVLYTGAFIAEIVRAGIQSVAKGQSEAARALGLSESQRLRLVVLPQALRVIVPPLTSQYLNLTKNSSLAIAVGYPDFWNISNTTMNQSGRILQIMLIAMGVYLSISLFISFFLNWYNRRIALVER